MPRGTFVRFRVPSLPLTRGRPEWAPTGDAQKTHEVLQASFLLFLSPSPFFFLPSGVGGAKTRIFRMRGTVRCCTSLPYIFPFPNRDGLNRTWSLINALAVFVASPFSLFICCRRPDRTREVEELDSESPLRSRFPPPPPPFFLLPSFVGLTLARTSQRPKIPSLPSGTWRLKTLPPFFFLPPPLFLYDDENKRT